MANIPTLQADERVSVYALRDILRDPGNPAAGVVVRRGAEQLVYRVDARERYKTGDWGPRPPDSEAPVSRPAPFSLTEIPGISRHTAGLLAEAGYGSVEQLRRSSVAELTAIDGIGTKYAEIVLRYVQGHYSGAREEGDVDG